MDFMKTITALIPPPRANLVRYNGVFSPNSKYRQRIVPKPKSPSGCRTIEGLKNEKKNKKKPRTTPVPITRQPGTHRSQHIPWRELLKRIFRIDMSKCPDCGGELRFVSYVHTAEAIRKILDHLGIDPIPPPKPIAPPSMQEQLPYEHDEFAQ